MDNQHIKASVAGALDGLKDLEERAGKLENKNLRDVIAAAFGRLHQVANHPDLELLGDDAQPRTVDNSTQIDHSPQTAAPNPFNTGVSTAPLPEPVPEFTFPPAGTKSDVQDE